MPKKIALYLELNSTNHEKHTSLALAYMLTFNGISNGVNSVLNFLGFRTVLDTAVIYILLFSFCGYFLFRIFLNRYLYKDEAVMLFFMIISYGFACFTPNGNAAYMRHGLSDYIGNSFYVLFIYAMPAYFMIRRIQDYSIFHNYLLRFSYLSVSMSVFTYLFTDNAFAQSYMTLSYNMLLQTVVLLMHRPHRYKIMHYALTALGCYVIAVGGARGALVGLLVAIALMIFVANYTAWKKALLIILIVLTIVIASTFYDVIVLEIGNFLEKAGIESRTYDLLFLNEGEEINDSGRSVLYEKALQSVTLLGNGMFADRVILGGSYVHNLFIELLVDYGYILGSGLSLLIIWLILTAVIRTQSSEWRLIVMLIPNGLVMLMFSNSYLLQNPCFYTLIGVCVNSFVRRK